MTNQSDVRAIVPYILLANGRVALRFLETMEDRGSPPVLIVLNAPEKQRAADDIKATGERLGVEVREWSSTTRDVILDELRKHADAWILSIYFGHLLDQQLLSVAGMQAVNLHASLLPWCRGANTNVYPLLEHCPAGVTLHAMTPDIDAGAILVQREVPVRPWDTGGTLYARLEDEGLRLLSEHWPEGVLAAWPGVSQTGKGSKHGVSDFAQLDAYSLEGRPEARAFFDLLRARTFPPNTGLRVLVDGHVVEATITLREVERE